ncbi:hypothetical protein EVG20_g9115 [Dentipellis fragilis]|uniref:NADP-dependent oxidoreductase domain-containing protein n=1 Tax=Dentipellis fragilis TaxID=205917 RepID=A0A4Y9Y0M2_9AGAM|nr:hypothetical protein EVG20_g9115 [Dentipellis fragilis]
MSKQLVWLITGTSSGIGRDLTLAALNRGDKVIATARARSLGQLDALKEMGANTLQLDVTAPLEELRETARKAIAIHGHVDVVVNNAGYIEVGTLEETTEEETYNQFNTLIFGGLNVARAFLPSMRERKTGTVVWIGSLGGWHPAPNGGLYGAAKYATRGVSETLDEEISPLGLRSIVFELGYFRTNFLTDGHRAAYKPRIEDYKPITEAANARLVGACFELDPYNQRQPGDPTKGVQVIIDLVHGEGAAQGRKVPSVVALGSDCFDVAKGSCEKTLANLKEWEAVTKSTDFPKESERKHRDSQSPGLSAMLNDGDYLRRIEDLACTMAMEGAMDTMGAHQPLYSRQTRTLVDAQHIKVSFTLELQTAPENCCTDNYLSQFSHSTIVKMSKSTLNIVMGSMTFGAPGKEGARVHDLKDVEAILDAFQQHGHTEIDTARVYCGGTCEEYLGKIDWQSRGLKMETKLYPVPQKSAFFNDIINHTPENMRRHLDDSLKALNTDTLEMWYLHGPDRSTPYEVTLKAVNEFYKEGKFKRFGISNYMAAVEPELFPCLRKYGISFYEFNPLGGGFFTGRYHSLNDQVEAGSRFDPNRMQGQGYRKRHVPLRSYPRLDLTEIQAVADKHNLTMAEVALRWVSHHSLMKREFGDSVLIGASSVEHIKQNLVDLEKGPLPDEVVSVLDEAWIQVQPYSSTYFH